MKQVLQQIYKKGNYTVVAYRKVTPSELEIAWLPRPHCEKQLVNFVTYLPD